jgi:hypothetical protein
VFVRPQAEVDTVRRLRSAGANASSISRETGVPRTTVRDWLRDPEYRAGSAFRNNARRLDVRALPRPAYAYMLGLYLGDGHVLRARGCFQLRITLDSRYPDIIRCAAGALRILLPANVVAVRPVPGERCVIVSASSTLWPALLPQHGPGPKHLRRIELAPWQRTITGVEATALVRGLIHSDGCRYTATVRRRGRTYRYARYAFANRSDDIKRIFCAHLDHLGIGWTRPNEKDVAVARRADVARMDRFIGPKR